jgi:hypothetical protein
MVSAQKKAYMKFYNRKPEVKQKKVEYMRKIRAANDEEASKKLVQSLLDLGFEQLAFEYAQERAPEMLASVKVPARRKRASTQNLF